MGRVEGRMPSLPGERGDGRGKRGDDDENEIQLTRRHKGTKGNIRNTVQAGNHNDCPYNPKCSSLLAAKTTH